MEVSLNQHFSHAATGGFLCRPNSLLGSGGEARASASPLPSLLLLHEPPCPASGDRWGTMLQEPGEFLTHLWGGQGTLGLGLQPWVRTWPQGFSCTARAPGSDPGSGHVSLALGANPWLCSNKCWLRALAPTPSPNPSPSPRVVGVDPQLQLRSSSHQPWAPAAHSGPWGCCLPAPAIWQQGSPFSPTPPLTPIYRPQPPLPSLVPPLSPPLPQTPAASLSKPGAC